jgi:hypothetical protein
MSKAASTAIMSTTKTQQAQAFTTVAHTNNVHMTTPSNLTARQLSGKTYTNLIACNGTVPVDASNTN